MWIKTRLRINLFISLGVMLAIALVLGWAFLEASRAEQCAELTAEIQKTAMERSLLRDEYLMHPTDRARIQWYAKTAAFEGLLEQAEKRFTADPDRALLSDIRKAFAQTVALLSRIVENEERRTAAETGDLASPEGERRIAGQMLHKSYLLHNLIDRFKVSAEKASASAHRTADLLVVLLLGVSLAAIISNSYAISRILTKGLDRLQEGTRIIGRGNLDHRIQIAGNNELSVLAGDFSEMAAKLEATHTARVNLEKEILERRIAEDALRDSETRFRELFDNMGNGVAVYKTEDDGKSFLFEDINRAGEQLSQVKREEILGTSIAEVFPGVEAMGLCAVFQRVWETGVPERLPATLYRDERIAHWVDNYVYRLPTGEIVAVYDDVSERKQFEDALRESEGKYRRIFENAVEGIFQTTPEGSYLTVNPAFARMFGYASPGEMMASVMDIKHQLYVHPEDRDVFKRRLEEQGHVLGFEAQFYHRSGSILWASINAYAYRNHTGKTLWYEGTAEDITHRKQAEEALRQSEASYRTLSENIPGIVYRVFIREGWRMEFYNRMVWSITGCEPSELTHGEVCSIDPLIVEEDRDGVIAAIKRSIADGKPFEAEYRLKHKDGRIVYVNERGQAVRGDDGGPLFIDGVIFDVTERRRAEQEKHDIEVQLHQAQKMEAVGRLAGGIVHDFNNMLGVILGYGELALAGIDQTDPLHEYLQEIVNAGKRSRELTRQLLTFSRKQVVSPVVTDINDRIKGMERLLRRTIGEDVDLEFIPSCELWLVYLDPSQVDQAVANLAVNSRDAMPDGGKLILQTANVIVDEDFCVKHPQSLPGDYVLLTVSDTGCGMDEQTLEHVFEPFFTTKEEGRGTGLGLATVYGIVRQNGGIVTIDSEPGQGTTVRLYFPRHSGETEAQSVAPPASDQVLGHGTVLLVEDDVHMRGVVRALLEEIGFDVLEAADPRDAVTIAQAPGRTIHLLLTDVVLPFMSGKELQEKLRSMGIDIKTLFMSGFPADIIARHGVHRDGIHFIQKPFSLNALAEKIREVMES